MKYYRSFCFIRKTLQEPNFLIIFQAFSPCCFTVPFSRCTVSHQNIFTMAKYMVNHFKLIPGQYWTVVLPLFYIMCWVLRYWKNNRQNSMIIKQSNLCILINFLLPDFFPGFFLPSTFFQKIKNAHFPHLTVCKFYFCLKKNKKNEEN